MNHALRIFPRFRAAAILVTSLGLALGAAAQSGNIAINTTGAAAAPQALLDVSSISKGLLIPRMATLPLTAPEGLTAYHTHATDAESRGFYIFKDGLWQRLRSGKNGWDLYGNTLYDVDDPNPNFIGTTDDRPLYFRTNNVHRMKLDGVTGNLSVGHPPAYTAQQRMDINGALSLYYEPAPGNQASKTDAPGVFRYQPFGVLTGTVPYRYGNREIPAVKSAVGTIPLVLGATNNYPLQYAAHWGNVDGTALEQGVNLPAVKQPRNNGWRAFENPYTEKLRVNWFHFRDAVCTATPDEAIIPSGVPPLNSLNNPPAAERLFVTPFYHKIVNNWMRRQYLFRASELSLELGQLGGNTGAVEGLCPGGVITAISIYINAGGSGTITNGNISVTVRNAPTGLDVLNGFDNTPDGSGTMGCGTFSTWPLTAALGWQLIPLNQSSFKWDGYSNVIVEVAGIFNNASGISKPVWCSNTGFNATYGAYFGSLPAIHPDPGTPGWSCNNSTNVATRMVDNMPPPATYTSGTSTFRPKVKFHGTVAKAGPAGVGNISGIGNYIHYTGALVLEDGDITTTEIPWGMWRPGHPVGNPYYAYKGNGTISAQRGIFDNASRLNDHVFDRAFDGRVAPTDAAQFGEQRLLPLGELEPFTRTNRHLPTMKGRAEWDRSGGFSLGDLTNQLWATTETHALYVTELHDKLNVIEMLTNDRPLTAAEFCTARQQLAAMAEYTDAQKARLIAALRKRAPLTPLSR